LARPGFTGRAVNAPHWECCAVRARSEHPCRVIGRSGALDWAGPPRVERWIGQGGEASPLVLRGYHDCDRPSGGELVQSKDCQARCRIEAVMAETAASEAGATRDEEFRRRSLVV